MSKNTSTVSRIFDNTENGEPNFCIDTTDGKRLYVKEHTDLQKDDVFTYEEIDMKTSKNGNQYFNVKNVEKNNGTKTYSNGSALSNGGTSQEIMFITGVVGRSMGSGKFEAHDIEALTVNAKRAFEKI